MHLVNNTSTTSKRSIWPPKTHNLWVEGAWDSRLRLSNGKAYDDWASALGANTLGYGRFNRIHRFQPATSLPWDRELIFADEFCEAMETEAVRFFKSGSDAVSCAVRLARAYTGRSKIIAFNECYHGTGDWFGCGLWSRAGIVDSDNLVLLPFGEQRVRYWAKDNDIAAIVLEPVPKSIVVPPPGWLTHIREVCNEYGIILISDEIILGYRHGLQGFLRSVGLRSDLACYGKAMGQGAAISACTGRRDIMDQLTDRVHFSGTNNGEPLALDIARDTLSTYQRINACGRITDRGQYLRDLLHDEHFETHGLDERYEIVGTKDAVEFCFDHGILYPGFVSMAVTHTYDQCTALVETLCKWREHVSRTDL